MSFPIVVVLSSNTNFFLKVAAEALLVTSIPLGVDILRTFFVFLDEMLKFLGKGDTRNGSHTMLDFLLLLGICLLSFAQHHHRSHAYLHCNSTLSNSKHASCNSIFDWKWYSEYYGISFGNESDAFEHWRTKGIDLGYRFHPGPRVFKVIVITRNEWPMIKSWVLYHSKIFGPRNVYVISGCSDPRSIHFLQHAHSSMGVHVSFSKANLNELREELQSLAESIRYTNFRLLYKVGYR